jgi:hypothetical protein
MTTPDHDRAIDRLSNPDSRAAEPSGARVAPALIAIAPSESVESGADKAPLRLGRRTRRPERLPSRVRFRPQVGLLEQRSLLSTLPTLTALSASALSGEPVFTATVTDLSAGGATPNGGTVTFSDKGGVIDSATLDDGVATFTASSLPAGTITVTASYGGTSEFAASTTGTIVTAAGNGTAGYTGNNGPATAAELNGPVGMAVDSAGDLFIADFGNNVIREVVKATGDIITVAGNGKAGYSGDKGSATSAELDGPRDLAFDSAGDLFFSDMNNNVIREVIAATGDIVTVAGTGTAGYRGDNGPATAAELDSPRGIAFDSAGDLFIADLSNDVIREVVKATGDIITVAGDGTPGYKGDKGPATAAELNNPNTVAVDSAGNLFIADEDNYAIREVVKSTGDIITVAGNGKAGYSGDNGPATAAELYGSTGIGVDSLGDLFIGDGLNYRIREVVKATGDIITVAGNGIAGYSGDGGTATSAELDGSGRVAVDPAGNVFVGDGANNAVREITPAVTVTIIPSQPAGGGGDSGGGGSGGGEGDGGGEVGGGGGGGGAHGPSPVPPTPPPAPRPLPLGFLRTPPKIVRVATKMVDRTPEIVIQLDQGIVSKIALGKAWYTVERPEATAVLGTSGDPHVAASRVIYQAKTHTITLVMPRRPKMRGDVVLTVDARGIVNLLGQDLEGNNAVPGVNLVREVGLP